MTIEVCLCYFDGLCSISLNSGGGVCNWFFRLCVRFLDFLLHLFFGLVWFGFFGWCAFVVYVKLLQLTVGTMF